MTTARDTHNQIEYAKEIDLEEGLAKGREEERNSIVLKMLKNNLPVQTICDVTGLSLEEGRLLSLRKASEYASLDNIDKQNYVKAMTTARDTHNQIEYAKETGLEEGLAKGLAKGREEGREERNLEVAINLLQLGTPCEIVAKATGLSVEEVLKLQKES